jgi:putative ABC transport system substrate-binding protein
MQRRQFMTLLGASAAAWPLVARAQQPGRRRRIGVLIGVLMGNPSKDPVGQALATALMQGLRALHWHEGDNLRIEWRVPALFQRYAGELVALSPDVILAQTSPAVVATPGDEHDPGGLYNGYRSSWSRPRRESSSPWWEYNRL